ncbi:MAG: pantetheine-phosphate adenylyltransferase [Oscillospiraceae bacterium]|nr:pantetheine-phosphate adenylyltransferase [Oscillospiraceae bacterium]
MRTAVCPGSFDPVTKGHLDIIKRASRLFDKVIVVVLQNTAKHSTFSVEERVHFIQESTRDIENVSVESYDGLLMDYCRLRNAVAVVKGLRAVTDFEYEFQMSLINKQLNPDIETVFINTAQEYMFLSSSVVREVASFGGDVSQFVPDPISEEITKKLVKGGDTI